MFKLDKHRLDMIFEKFNSLNIAVIGDIMIDIYYWGTTTRISPEAPVPVVDLHKEEFKPGGAANVAINIKSLNAKSHMFGVVGTDDSGINLIDYFNKNNIDTSGIIRDNDRPTTTKTRVLVSGQHVVRFDKEVRDDLNKELEDNIIENLTKNISYIDAIILEDYNKGVLTERVIKSTIEIANKHHKITSVDPKLKNFECYKHATLFKPNLKETEEILKRKISTMAEIEKAGFELLELLDNRYVVITLSERGIALFTKNKPMKVIAAKSAKIANVSGAGDTVIATLTAALCAGAQFEEACTLSNYAASVVVEDVSIIPICKNSLYKRLVDSGVVISS